MTDTRPSPSTHAASAAISVANHGNVRRRRAFAVGARGSRLSCLQTEAALCLLRREFPGTDYRLVPFSTPGDRDLTTPIERSAPDFFTRDLDDAVRAGTIDFAIHSAKDLPSPMADDLDWFWLPAREDPRDAWVTRPGRRLSQSIRIGVSSERRAAYARKVFPKAKLLPIRGAVDARLEQVRKGAYDAVLMAMAGLRRLCGGGLPEGVEVTPISLDELTPPEAQGYLAVVFKAGDERLMAMRQRFVKAVRFVSAGVGDAGLCTIAGQRDIAAADTVLHDALFDLSLVGQKTVDNGLRINVGKRCGAHTMTQAEITRLICDEARKGRRVVRLKGGDAGLFGRLAEETDDLTALRIPFIVRPGVSALTAATTGTGILLTRRGESRGFTAYTPRSTGTETPQVLFMSLRVAAEEAKRLRKEGWPAKTPCAFVFDAAGLREEVIQTTLGEVKSIAGEDRPGLLIVGHVATHRWPTLGELAGRRVLLTCSEAVQDKAVLAVEDRGGKPIRWPLIRLVPRKISQRPSAYDGIVLTSPSAVRIFFASCPCDRRELPEFFTCGAGTDAELRKYGVSSDVMPAEDFSADGLITEIRGMDLRGRHILRLRSAKAGPTVARALKRAGAKVDDVILYDNEFCAPADKLPPFDDVFFASASAVESFLAQYGAAKLRGKGIYVMGAPTRAALPPAMRPRAQVFGLDAGCVVKRSVGMV